LFGTWSLVAADERPLLRGFVLNKFRGDESLLAPAPEDLRRATGMACLGVLPFVDHGLPDEDGAAPTRPQPGLPRVAAVRYPTASNLDELQPLRDVADLVWARSPNDLSGAGLVVLPGSKHVAADLAWLAERGLGEAVVGAARDGTRVLGICGGMQILGETLRDAGGVDGSGSGLGLLPLETTFGREKRTEVVDVSFEELPEPWSALVGLTIRGYEIRHGETVARDRTVEALPGGRAFASGNVLGVTVHGLFESPEVVEALVGRAPGRTLEEVFDGLADLVEERLDVEELARLAGVA
jgi:adenosylcobyric acid synthase